MPVLRSPSILAAPGRPSPAQRAIRGRLARLVAALGLVAAVVGGSTAVYWLLHHGRFSVLDCLYMSVITVSTVGYGEIIPIDTPQLRLLTMFLIVTGTGSLVYFAGSLAGLFVEGDLRRYVEELRMNSRIASLSDHVIVCGGGATGREATLSLRRAGIRVVVIERSDDIIDRLAREVDDDVVVVQGDALDDEVLRATGIVKARALVTALSDDPDNLYVLVASRAIAPHVPVVARAHTEAAARKLRSAGASQVVSPNALGGGRLAMEIAHPELTAFYDLVSSQRDGSMRLDVVTIGAHSRFAGQTLNEADLRHVAPDTLVVAIRDRAGETVFVPRADYVLHEGVTLILFGHQSQIEALRQLVLR